MKCSCPSGCTCCSNECSCKSQWDGHKFWIIISPDSHVYPGRFVRHTSKVLADDEAKKFAAQERKVFLVLETVDGFQPPEQVEQIKFKEVPF